MLINSINKTFLEIFKPDILLIASSTGGPQTLEKIFAKISGTLRIPIIIVQHMPPVFTSILADKITSLSKIECAEAQNQQSLSQKKIYIAPGDFHLSLIKVENEIFLNLTKTEPRNFVRPCADYLFESAAHIYGNTCLGLVLTGMGSDGRDGALEVRKQGGKIIIQDKESSVVWGMPSAVYQANAFDDILSIEELTKLIQQKCCT
ncbi:MAG: chemotaxis protein CheB [Silvanigrellaceae bacterium]|nr:chemotaxis protein CheB [Silvanigrellaceae bacterium]